MINPRRKPGTKPEVKILDSARPMLTPAVKAAVDSLLQLLDRHAQQCGVQVLGAEIRGFKDPEEGWDELVVTQLVDLPDQAAMDYWDSIGDSLAGWRASLPEEQAEILQGQVAVEVEGDGRRSAA